MKSSCVGGGGAVVTSEPPKFWLLKIWAKSLKIRVKMAPKVDWLQKMEPKVCKITREDLFWSVTSKKDLNDLCGRKFVGKSCIKVFSGKFGEIREKILRTSKDLPAPTPMMKRFLHPRCPSFERTEGVMPPPSSLCILFYTHPLYSLL